MSTQALCRYLDSRVSALFLPAARLSANSANRSPGEPEVYFKPWKENATNEPMSLLCCSFPEVKLGLLCFTDGDPMAMSAVLLSCVAGERFGVLAAAGNLIRLRGSAYLENRMLTAGVYLRPDTIAFSRRVAVRPRGDLAGWRLLLFVPITDVEYRLGRRSLDAMFQRFEEMRRDIMTVNPPFQMPE